MKDSICWPFVAVINIAAFIISLIGSILGGVGIGLLLLRLIAVLAVFSVIAIGLSILVAGTFPEIFTVIIDNDNMGTEDVVDILVDGDVSPDNEDVMEKDNSKYTAMLQDRANPDNDYSFNIPKKNSNTKAEALANQYFPDEMAHAVHTVMHKDKKG